jgi:hypothetical protein
MLKTRMLIIMILAILLTGTGLANADSGTLACVARHVPEVVQASFQLSNFNDDAVIRIEQILVYNMQGDLLCRGPEGWGNSDNWVLRPNAGTWFSGKRLIDWCTEPPGITSTDLWLIVKAYWVSEGPTLFPLYGQTTEVAQRNKVPVSRSSLKCDTVEYSGRR